MTSQCSHNKRLESKYRQEANRKNQQEQARRERVTATKAQKIARRKELLRRDPAHAKTK